MRLYLVLDETRFYHPGFVADLVRKTTDEIIGAAVVTRIPRKNSLEEYLKRNVMLLTPFEIAKLLAQRFFMSLKEKLIRPAKDGPFCSVRAVYEYFGIDYIEVRHDINKPEYLAHIRRACPDVIVSSNSLIFGKELRSIPTRCVLNRHSSLLPSYGGLWPVFQAYRRGERFTGVSVHTMEAKIDRGVVLARRQVEIREGRTLADLYEECFSISADVVLEAIEKVRAGDITSCDELTEPSYFSFPTKAHWAEFRSRGGKFI